MVKKEIWWLNKEVRWLNKEKYKDLKIKKNSFEKCFGFYRHGHGPKL